MLPIALTAREDRAMSSITTNERELMKANLRDWNKHAVAGSDEPGCWRLPGDPIPLSFTCSARKMS
jgi:hypothetical protein